MAPVQPRKMQTKPPVKGACPGFETCTRVAQRMPVKVVVVMTCPESIKRKELYRLRR
jgi:hypothetical protein